jgi:hypothetical protein
LQNIGIKTGVRNVDNKITTHRYYL